MVVAVDRPETSVHFGTISIGWMLVKIGRMDGRAASLPAGWTAASPLMGIVAFPHRLYERIVGEHLPLPPDLLWRWIYSLDDDVVPVEGSVVGSMSSWVCSFAGFLAGFAIVGAAWNTFAFVLRALASAGSAAAVVVVASFDSGIVVEAAVAVVASFDSGMDVVVVDSAAFAAASFVVAASEIASFAVTVTVVVVVAAPARRSYYFPWHSSAAAASYSYYLAQ